MTLTVYKDRKKEWRWKLRASNGRIVADSAEGYSSKWNAQRAALMFKVSVAIA